MEKSNSASWDFEQDALEHRYVQACLPAMYPPPLSTDTLEFLDAG